MVAASGKFWSLLRKAPEPYSWSMTNRTLLWTRRNVTDFLAENDFSFSEELAGSVQSWIKLTRKGEPDRIVEVPPAHTFYTQKQFARMIHQSGVPEDKWFKWAWANKA